jgi:hypothetical protein
VINSVRRPNRPAARTRALIVLALLCIVTAIGAVALSLSVHYSGPSTFSCTGTPARCGEDHGSASVWLTLIGVVDSSTTITSPAGLWVARACLAPVIVGWTVALALAMIVAVRNWIDLIRRRQRLRRMRQRHRTAIQSSSERRADRPFEDRS